MDRHIDARTLSENLDEILEEAATGVARFVVTVNGHSCVIMQTTHLAEADPTPEDDVAARFGQALDGMWANTEARNLPPMTMDEIDEEIAAVRRERREAAPTT